MAKSLSRMEEQLEASGTPLAARQRRELILRLMRETHTRMASLRETVAPPEPHTRRHTATARCCPDPPHGARTPPVRPVLSVAARAAAALRSRAAQVAADQLDKIRGLTQLVALRERQLLRASASSPRLLSSTRPLPASPSPTAPSISSTSPRLLPASPVSVTASDPTDPRSMPSSAASSPLLHASLQHQMQLLRRQQQSPPPPWPTHKLPYQHGLNTKPIAGSLEGEGDPRAGLFVTPTLAAAAADGGPVGQRPRQAPGRDADTSAVLDWLGDDEAAAGGTSPLEHDPTRYIDDVNARLLLPDGAGARGPGGHAWQSPFKHRLAAESAEKQPGSRSTGAFMARVLQDS